MGGSNEASLEKRNMSLEFFRCVFQQGEGLNSPYNSPVDLDGRNQDISGSRNLRWSQPGDTYN